MCPDVKFLGISLYYIGYILSYLAVVVYALLLRKKYSFSILRSILMSILIIPLANVIMGALSFLDPVGGFNWVRAVLFIPAAVYIISFVMDTPFTKTMDFLAPAAALNHGIAHFFCIFEGCCYGYPSQFGIWNEKQQATLFPIQTVESISILLIFVFMIIYQKKKNYNTHGISYAQHLLLFGFTRFIYEFFRDDTEIRWHLSVFQGYTIAEFVLGIIGIILIAYFLKHKDITEKHELTFREDIGELTRIKMSIANKKASKKSK